MSGYWRDLWRRIKPSREQIIGILYIMGIILVGTCQAMLIFLCLSIVTSNFTMLYWVSSVGAMLLMVTEALLWLDYGEYKERLRNKK